MRILLLRSERRGADEGPKEPYLQEFGSAFAERVIANLRSEPGGCGACGPDCTGCRRDYGRTFTKNIAGVICFPSRLPFLLERPEEYIPARVPRHDVLLALNVHEQILLAILERARAAGARAAIAPIESRDWVSRSAQERARKIGAHLDMEVAFPKPFCAFDPPKGSRLDRFRRTFHIGKPEVRLEISDGRIVRAHVETSAACGATYYIARWLVGRRTDEDLRHDVVARRLHSYPCTASMAWDDDLGDTILHVSGEAHYAILAPLGLERSAGPEMIRSPAGRMVYRPAPVQENVRNVAQAREVLLRELARHGRLSLSGFRRSHTLSPAAVHTAVLLLKQEGKIVSDGDGISLVHPQGRAR